VWWVCLPEKPVCATGFFYYFSGAKMAIQTCGGSRDKSKNADSGVSSGINTKVAASAGKPSIGKRPTQNISGKLNNGTSAMPGAGTMTKGGPIKTIASQPITGKNGNGTTPMGCGDIIKGVI
jgi:hypothetical protein